MTRLPVEVCLQSMGKDLMNCEYYEDREKNYSLLLDVYEKKANGQH